MQANKKPPIGGFLLSDSVISGDAAVLAADVVRDGVEVVGVEQVVVSPAAICRLIRSVVIYVIQLGVRLWMTSAYPPKRRVFARKNITSAIEPSMKRHDAGFASSGRNHFAA